MAALCNPNVIAAKDIEGSLNIKSIRINTGGGIKRNKNEIILIIVTPILLFKINIKMGGKLIAIPEDKRHKTIVSNNCFKKSYEIKLKFDIKRLLIELKGIEFLLNIKLTKKDKENKLTQNKAITKEVKNFLEEF